MTAAGKPAAAATPEDTRTVLAAMIRTRHPVSFTAIAAAAGVSRDYLYRNPSLAQAIRAARTPKTALTVPVPGAGFTRSWPALREHLRRLTAEHQREVAAPREGNQQLRRQLETSSRAHHPARHRQQ